MGGFGLVDGGVVVGTGFLQDLRRELQADVAAVQDGLGALGGVVGGTELLDDSSAVGVMTLAAVGNQEADLITQVHALAALLGQQELDIAATVGLDGQTAILGQADSAGKAVVRHGDFQNFTLRGTFHAGMVKQFDENLIVGHGTVQGAAGNENVALAVITAGKAEAGGQLDQRARNAAAGSGGVLVGGKTGHVGAVFHGQFTGGDHGGDRGAQAGIIHLQVVLQLAQRHGTALDGGKDVFL